MPCRQGLVAVLACLAVFVPTSAGLAAQSLGPPSGTPDPRQMVLVAADLGGAKVTHQGYYKDRDFPSTISYSREFDAGRYQGTPLLYVDSEAEMGTSAESTSQYLLTIRRALSTKQGRALFLRSFESSFPKGGLVSKSQVGRPRTIPLGAGAFDLPITFRLLGLRTEVHLTAFAVERALGSLVTIGVPGSRVPVSRLVSLGKIVSGRMTAQLSPVNVVLPTISGTAQDTQTLTGSSGTWTGVQATLTYQWQRCDPVGANCVAVPGASAATYVVTTADVGATLRLSVTAQNGAGRATAVSQPTAVVIAAA